MGRFSLLIVVFLATIFVARATAQEQSREALQEQIRQLRSRVAALEARSAQSNLEQQRLVETIVQDAQKRSRLLVVDDNVTGGYDKGFFLRSSDGNFSMRPSVLFQFRNITNIFSSGEDGEDGIENGFEFRRLRPRFDGNAISPALTYSIVLDVSRTTGTVSLLDAWTQYQITPTWAIRGGQFRNSWYHEGDVSDPSQLAVERSLIDAYLGGSQTDRVQGVEMIYGQAKLPVRIVGGFHDGANSKNTNFQDAGTNFGFSGRAEYKLRGSWADYKDFSAHVNNQDLFIVGAGFDWTEASGVDFVRTTVDAQYETTTRWALYGALTGVQMQDNAGDNFDYGAMGQIGYAFNPRWEPFVRYEFLGFSTPTDETFNVFTVGVTYFLPEQSHRAKFGVDLMYLPDGAPADATGVGVLTSGDAQLALRAQFQLIL
jgi:hypothetical protein